MSVPLIFVSTGTLVPATPSLEKVPRLLRAPLYLPHKLGIGPSPDRFLADAAYGPLKELRDCWVEPLSWLGLDDREVSIAAAKCKLQQMLRVYPGRKVIVVGQSQGGLVAAELALDPELTDSIVACVMAGAPFMGSPATQSRLLGWSTCFPGVEQMQPGHPSLQSLRERAFAQWPSSVASVTVGDPDDELVPLESAFGLELADHIETRMYWISSRPPGEDYPNMKHLEAAAGQGAVHIRMCRRPSWIELIKELRSEFTPGEEVQPLHKAA